MNAIINLDKNFSNQEKLFEKFIVDLIPDDFEDNENLYKLIINNNIELGYFISIELFNLSLILVCEEIVDFYDSTTNGLPHPEIFTKILDLTYLENNKITRKTNIIKTSKKEIEKVFKDCSKKGKEIIKFFEEYLKSIINELLIYKDFLPEEINNVLKTNSNLSSKEILLLFYNIENFLGDNIIIIPPILHILINTIIINYELNRHTKLNSKSNKANDPIVLNGIKNLNSKIDLGNNLIILNDIKHLKHESEKQIKINLLKILFGLEVSTKVADNFSKSPVKDIIGGIPNKEKQKFMGKLVLSNPKRFLINGQNTLLNHIISLNFDEKYYEIIMKIFNTEGIDKFTDNELIKVLNQENLNNLNLDLNLGTLKQMITTSTSIESAIETKEQVLPKITLVIDNTNEKFKEVIPEDTDIKNTLKQIFGEVGGEYLFNNNKDILSENIEYINKIGELLENEENQLYFCDNFKELLTLNIELETQLKNIISALSFFNNIGIKQNIISKIILLEMNSDNITKLYEISNNFDKTKIHGEGFINTLVNFMKNGDKELIKDYLNNEDENSDIPEPKNEVDILIAEILEEGDENKINELKKIIIYLIEHIHKSLNNKNLSSTIGKHGTGCGSYTRSLLIHINDLENKINNDIFIIKSIDFKELFNEVEISGQNKILHIHEELINKSDKNLPLIETLINISNILREINNFHKNKKNDTLDITDLIKAYSEISIKEIDTAKRKILNIINN